MEPKKVIKALKEVKLKEKVNYPENHKLGIKVPHGGSMCGNCKFLGEDHKTCMNKEFIKWNKSNILPNKDEEYCCDLWSFGKKAITEKENNK